jgi:hypothetical protein
MKKIKVFGVGLSKTATSSLNSALEVLGYRSKHFPIGMVRYDDGKISLVRSYVNKFDALTDTPVARFYKELDKEFPGSKFILTIRDHNSWIKSCRTHPLFGSAIKWEKRTSKIHEDLYGTINFDKKKFIKAYDKHVKEVKSYFKGRKKDFLVLDICGGKRWKELCDFLGEPIPDKPFPMSNVSKNNPLIYSVPHKIKNFFRSL